MKFGHLVEICFLAKFENAGKILKILCVRCHFVNYLSGSRKKFSLVLLQITNYIPNP